MPLDEKERLEWSNFVMNYFSNLGFKIEKKTENPLLFSISNVCDLGIELSNKYGIITASFKDLKVKNKFLRFTSISRDLKILTDDELNTFGLDENLKKIPGINEIFTYSSLLFPCRIFTQLNSKEIRFYDFDIYKSSNEIIDLRKNILQELLTQIRKMGHEIKNNF